MCFVPSPLPRYIYAALSIFDGVLFDSGGGGGVQKKRKIRPKKSHFIFDFFCVGFFVFKLSGIFSPPSSLFFAPYTTVSVILFSIANIFLAF